jgi:hypothetical protein
MMVELNDCPWLNKPLSFMLFLKVTLYGALSWLVQVQAGSDFYRHGYTQPTVGHRWLAVGGFSFRCSAGWNSLNAHL